MSKISDGNIKMGTRIKEQMITFHKFEASSKEQFDELMKVMNYMEEEKKKKDKLKAELRNIKGPKKNLAWKKKLNI